MQDGGTPQGPKWLGALDQNPEQGERPDPEQCHALTFGSQLPCVPPAVMNEHPSDGPPRQTRQTVDRQMIEIRETRIFAVPEQTPALHVRVAQYQQPRT